MLAPQMYVLLGIMTDCFLHACNNICQCILFDTCNALYLQWHVGKVLQCQVINFSDCPERKAFVQRQTV